MVGDTIVAECAFGAVSAGFSCAGSGFDQSDVLRKPPSGRNLFLLAQGKILLFGAFVWFQGVNIVKYFFLKTLRSVESRMTATRIFGIKKTPRHPKVCGVELFLGGCEGRSSVCEIGDTHRLARSNSSGGFSGKETRCWGDVVVVPTDADHDILEIRDTIIGRIER